MGDQLPRSESLDPKRLDADPQLELELAVSAEYRMFHSDFLSHSADDRDKAIWWFVRQRETCRNCGTRPDEWDETKGGRRNAYHGVIRQCPGCVVVERTEEAPQMQSGRGMHVAMMKVPREE
jgi:hypothetical protein